MLFSFYELLSLKTKSKSVQITTNMFLLAGYFLLNMKYKLHAVLFFILDLCSCSSNLVVTLWLLMANLIPLLTGLFLCA